MFFIPLSDLLEMMLASGPPTQLLAIAEWPLHKALCELSEDAQALHLSALSSALRFRPDPDCGYRAEGVEDAFWELRVRGVLEPVGSGLQAGWVPNCDALIRSRRLLFSLDPLDATAIHRAGVRWASFASTALKNWATPAASSEPKVSGERRPRHLSTPTRR